MMKTFLISIFFCVGVVVSAQEPLSLNDPVFQKLMTAVAGESSTANEPTGRWQLNDASGITAVDSSGHSHDGTLHGTDPGLPTWGTGPNSNGSIVFDAASVDQYIDLGSSSDVKPTTAGTFMFWCKITTLSSFTVLMSNGSLAGSGANGLSVEIAGGMLKADFNNGTTEHQVVDSATWEGGNWPTNTWIHYAVTWNSSTVNVYTNGILAHSEAQTVVPSPAYNLTLGWDGAHTSGATFKGSLDDCIVSTNAYTAGEVSAAYNGGAQ